MAHARRTACKYDDDAGPSGWVQEKLNKGKTKRSKFEYKEEGEIREEENKAESSGKESRFDHRTGGIKKHHSY